MEIPRLQLEVLRTTSGFTTLQIVRLLHIFNALNPQNGKIHTTAITRIPEFNFPLATRLPKALGIRTREIDFSQFVNALSVFNPIAPINEKASFLFKLYDQDGDGEISKSDLKKSLTLIVGDEDPALLDYVVERVFDEMGELGDGVKEEDFTKFVKNQDIKALINLNFLNFSCLRLNPQNATLTLDCGRLRLSSTELRAKFNFLSYERRRDIPNLAMC